MSSDPLLEIQGLRTWFFTSDGIVKAVDGVDLTLAAGEVVGLVGESGSGKTVTALSTLGLVDQPGRIVSGSVGFDGQEPSLTDRWLQAGLLPHFASLATRGCYHRLQTTSPPVSPVGWSTC